MNNSKCSLARLPGISALGVSVRAHTSVLAVAGQGWIWGSWGRLRSLESEDLEQQKAPKAHRPNQLQVSYSSGHSCSSPCPPHHGYQSHKGWEEEEELTVLYPAKI